MQSADDVVSDFVITLREMERYFDRTVKRVGKRIDGERRKWSVTTGK